LKTNPILLDTFAMGRALALAQRGAQRGEVPVGAVVVRGQRVIAGCGNVSHRSGDPTQHAEYRVLRRAAGILGQWRLTDLTLYTTVEPCVMCTAASLLFRIGHIVYGCREPKFGGVISRARVTQWGLNHQPSIRGGVRAKESADLMKKFFRARRIPKP